MFSEPTKSNASEVFKSITQDPWNTQTLSVSTDVLRFAEGILSKSLQSTSNPVFDRKFLQHNHLIQSSPLPQNILETISAPYSELIRYIECNSDIPKRCIQLIQEMEAALKILAASVLSGPGSVLLLLDRDDTIDGDSISYRRRIVTSCDDAQPCFRPGLVQTIAALSEMRGESLTIGLLTARSADSLFSSTNSLHSQWMEDTVHRDHRYSVAPWRQSPVAAKLSIDLLGPLFEQDTYSEVYYPSALGKLVAVKSIETVAQNRRVILFDDIPLLPRILPGQAIFAPPIGDYMADLFPTEFLKDLGLI